MEIELAILTEHLKIRWPYLHREKNDHRGTHAFLSQIISDRKRYFQKKGLVGYEPYDDAIAAFHDADKLLVSWGNKSSHSYDIVNNEANKLIRRARKH